MNCFFFKALFVLGILLSFPAGADDLEEAVIHDIKTRPDRLEQFEQFGALSLSNTYYLDGSDPSREKFLGHAFDLLFDVKGQGLDAKPSPERLERGKKWVFEIIFRHVNERLPNNGSEGFFKALKKIDPKQARGNGDFFILFSLIARFDTTLAFFKVPRALVVERGTAQYYDALLSFLKDKKAYDHLGPLGQDAYGRVSQLFNTSEHLKAYLSKEQSYAQVRDEVFNFLKLTDVGINPVMMMSEGFPAKARPWAIGMGREKINVQIKYNEAQNNDNPAPAPHKTLKDFVLYVVSGKWPYVPTESFDLTLEGTVQGVSAAGNSCFFRTIDGFFTETTETKTSQEVRQALIKRLRAHLHIPVIRFWLSHLMRFSFATGVGVFHGIHKPDVTYNNGVQLDVLLNNIETEGVSLDDAHQLFDAIAYMNSWNLYEFKLSPSPSLALYVLKEDIYRTTPFANRTFIGLQDPPSEGYAIAHNGYIHNPQLSFKAH